MSAEDTPRFIKLDAVAKQLSMGKSTILAWESAGKFPPAVRLSATVRVWLKSDVDAWVVAKHATMMQELKQKEKDTCQQQ